MKQKYNILDRIPTICYNFVKKKERNTPWAYDKWRKI